MTAFHSTAPKRILFFDSVCNLCNSWIDLLLPAVKSRPEPPFYFAPIQGVTAKNLLHGLLPETLPNSAVFYREGNLVTESAAVFEVCRLLGLPWSLLGLFRFLPRFITDKVYRLFARHRYQWFGKREQCRLPAPEERVYFLD